MKKAIVLFTLILWAGTAMAWKSSETPDKSYTFKFRYQGELLEIRKPAGSYEEAFEKAADLCFKHFKKGKGKLSEDQGLDIIDVCANPRS